MFRKFHRSFRKLNILPIKHLYYYKVLKIFFRRCGYQQSPIYSAYNLRSYSHAHVVAPTSRTTLFRNFYTTTSCKLFNILPKHLQPIRSLSIFLKEVKLWLLGFNHAEIETLLRPTI